MTLKRLFAEADAAEIEVAHKAARTTALETAANHPRAELRGALRFHYH